MTADLTRRALMGTATAAAVLPEPASSQIQNGTKAMTDMTNTDMTGTVVDILNAYMERWNEYDADGIIPFWDTDDDGIIYVAEEVDAVFGWDALEQYFRSADPETSDHLITFRDVTARLIAPSVIQAYWNMNWNIYFSTEKLYQKPIGGEVRVTALLRQRDDGWKFFHWIEGPLASLIQLKRAHEENVDPRLIEKLKAKGITF